MKAIARTFVGVAAGIALAGSTLVLTGTTAQAESTGAAARVSPNISAWVRQSGTSGGCTGQQWIVEGLGAHENQYGHAISNNGDVCAMTFQQGGAGSAFWGPNYTGSTLTTPTWYDGPGYWNKVCVWDWTLGAAQWCSSAY